MMIVNRFSLLLTVFLVPCALSVRGNFPELPMPIEEGEYIINGTLYDHNTNERYFLSELVYSESNGFHQGKIEISTSSNRRFSVHYSSDQKYSRILMYDYECAHLVYKDGLWDAGIPEVNKPMLNTLLLLGPSIVYRISSAEYVWVNGSVEQVRGVDMISYVAQITRSLKLTYYTKNLKKDANSVIGASRLEFNGYSPSSSIREWHTMEIYLNKITDQEVDKLVSPTPGIGCPVYFNDDSVIPLILMHDTPIHFIAIETGTGATSYQEKIEVHADSNSNMMKVFKTASNGQSSETIYDFNLAIGVKSDSEGYCLIQPIDKETLGLDERSRLDYNVLLWNQKDYFVGQLYYEHRPGFLVHAWESIEDHAKVQDTLYDKVVTTKYFAPSDDVNLYSGFMPVGATINAYNKDSKGAYKLIQTIRRDYYEFQPTISDEVVRGELQLSDCHSTDEPPITLALHFTCSGNRTKCISSARKEYYQLKSSLRRTLSSFYNIAPSRIGQLNLVFNGDEIIAYVQYLASPDPRLAFKTEYNSLSAKSGDNAEVNGVQDVYDCLRTSFNRQYTAIAYDDDKKLCLRFKALSDIVYDKEGSLVTLFYTPLSNVVYQNLLRQPSNSMILSILLKQTIDFSLRDFRDFYTFQMTRVEEVIDEKAAAHRLFNLEHAGGELVEDHSTVRRALSNSNLGQCSKACREETEGPCESFSFCSTSQGTECLVSSLIYSKVTDKVRSNSSCNIYSKDHLSDYSEIPKRKFSTLASVSLRTGVDLCSTLCSQSEQCFSFQMCDEICTLTGYYTDTATQFDEYCSIYIPQVGEKYQSAGYRTITETIHVELNLSYEQCAALCNDWNYDEETCHSFNYCPMDGKAVSTCELTKYSIGGPWPPASFKESTHCQNYGHVKERNDNRQSVPNSDKSVKVINRSSASGIIISMLFAGLILGLVLPRTVKKISRISLYRPSNYSEFERSEPDEDKNSQTSL